MRSSSELGALAERRGPPFAGPRGAESKEVVIGCPVNGQYLSISYPCAAKPEVQMKDKVTLSHHTS